MAHNVHCYLTLRSLRDGIIGRRQSRKRKQKLGETKGNEFVIFMCYK